jgi:cytochrome P450
MERWEREFVRGIVDGYIDGFVHAGRADLVRDFAFHYPLHVITVAAGLPKVDLETFYRSAALITNVAVAKEQRLEASAELQALLLRLIDGRRASRGGDDILSILCSAEYTDEHGIGQRLTDQEIVNFMRLLIPAGAQTTYRGLCNVLFGLLTHPDQLQRLYEERALLGPAIEEGLRWEVPLVNIGRTAIVETELGGVAVPEGCSVNVSVGAANRDPLRWDRPDEFDITRKAHPNLAFGTGVHLCLGIHFARMEIRVALERLLDRCENLRLDPAATDVFIGGLGMRSPDQLPVVFDAG